MTWTVDLADKVKKGLKRLPRHILANLLDWVEEVEERGLDEIRKLPGYHDEPLKGTWAGYRSIRLSRSYRAIYIVRGDKVKVVTVVEVNKHEY